ncbi:MULTISPECIES: FadR/GntR family transcriptional regulator [Flavobacteriaceae]|uniref:FadR family transcriptional regulator n=2 Tax=Flavobacteriaceae TaxID=49546 RepID=A0A4Y8AUI1_9FLAO|nr:MULTISPECIES: FCD domain-containing protein [Flavobacteriaceae]TEW75030.1 FadR family transcriptional regulator [Gramella jeungdoensis]GGK42126.1 GntR family transcriptional regulator [Lutibacter litoralis]
MKYLKKIKPLKNLSLVDKVEIRIIEFLKENNLKVGDSIPKELEFAEALGVSRTVVREAILRLRTLGIIESKKHKGMVLTEPDIILNIEKALDTKLIGEEMLKDIFELRLILEMGMADLLFARKTAEDLIELDKIVKKEEKDLFDSTIFSLEYEIRFHGKLYEMSGNNTLQRFQNLLLPVFQYYHDKKLPTDEKFEYSQKFVSHRDILNHLVNGSPESFRNAMRQHLEPHFDRVLNWIKA